jgi:protein ImuB
MPRVISVFLPTLSTDRVRRKAGNAAPPPETPLILVGREGRRRVVLAADAAAQAVGLRVGMPATKAQALVRGLVIQDANSIADAEALERLAFWMLQRFAPIVAADPPNGIVIDSTGADHLHGGEPATLAILVEKLAGVGLRARAAIADTWGAAHALAHFGSRPGFVSELGNAAHDVAPLSIAALRLASDMVRDLRVLGFDRVGDLLTQPRAPLTVRFGPELVRRLDQATGSLAEPIEPIRPEALIEVRRAFAEPIGAAQTVARYIARLAAELCDALERKGLGARRLDLICHRVDSQAQAVRVGTGLPLLDVKRMTRLLSDKIETIDPGFGIEVMTLAATVTEPLPPRQASSSLIDQQEPDVSGLVDLLANRVGEKNLYRAAPVASDVPERTVRHIPALSPETGAEWPGRWPRPSRLLTRPEAIDTVALLPDHPPASFTWRGVRRRVKRADGPERVFGEWWKRDPELTAVRDYFRLEDDAGERYWVYRAGDGEDPLTGSQRWFLHGIFG